ncbi:bifunctional adenosylcobinamide kinase/adenosylcobinamide-phosphate guanylyltransferase [Sphingopyxis panaciterrae]
MTAGTHLILGGARSGKSRHAQSLAEAFDGALLYIATGEAFDAEMAERIARHRADRGPRWTTHEIPLALPAAIAASSSARRLVLVECLTLWTSNLMHADRDIDTDISSLVDALDRAAGPVILVSNEVGLGIVPDNALARRFRDAAGRMNQAVAAAAQRVSFVAAGLPLRLK